MSLGIDDDLDDLDHYDNLDDDLDDTVIVIINGYSEHNIYSMSI